MPTSGSRVGRYELRERLGAGGMGEVFRARDRELGRDVAIKFLPAGYASDPARLARFGAEARAASALNHPNILTIHDVGEESGRQFIVMECVEGKTLRRLLHDRPLTPRQALDIAVQLADGLAKAHAAGIVHRDLKPENVMVTADGLVKIVDFGLARPSPEPGSPAGGHDSTETRVRGEWPETAEGTVLGTVGYMSPEQARGERVDHRSDQFALGAILYEMATGRRAFHGETSMDTLAAIIDREPEPIAGLNPSFPAPARWPIERCLAKRPADRYAVTEDLARELRTVRDHLGETTVSQPVTGRRPRRGAALRRWGLAGAAVLLIAGAFAVGLVGPPAWRRFWRPPLPSEIRLAVLPVSVPAAEADCCGGLAEYVSGRLVELGRLGRRVSVVPAVEVLSAGVTAPSAARRVLGATLVVTIAVNRSGDNYLVSVGLAETAPVREIVADTRTFPRGSYSPEEVANLVLPLLDLQLATAERSAWNGGAPAVARAGVLYAKGLALTPYQLARGKLEQYDQARDLEQAIKLFNDAIDLDPRYAAARADLGAARLRLYRLTRNPEDLSLAAQSARQALDLDATRPGAWMTLGMVSAQQGNLEEAQKNFDAAIARNPQGAETYRELGLACQRAGLWEKAEAAYRKAIELEPAAWPNHNYLGSFLFARRRLPEAEAEFKLALTMAPDNARVWSNLGGVYLAEQRWDEAESALTASSRAGAYGPALSNLGYLQMQARRQYAEAARTFERATGVAPRDSRIWMNLASARLFAGQRDGASDAYRRAAVLLEEERRIDPTNTATLVALAACYAGTGDAGRARSAVGQALRGQIAAEDWTGVVGVFETLGDRAAALRQVDAALRAGVAPADFEQDATFDVLRKDPRYGAIVRAHTSRTNGGRR